MNQQIRDAIANVDNFLHSKDRHSDWGKSHLRRLRGRVRSERLKFSQSIGTHTDEEWESLLNEFNYKCVICGCTPEGRPCKDHITPIYIGGSDSINNLQPVCRECNSSKGQDNTNWAEYRRIYGFEVF